MDESLDGGELATVVASSFDSPTQPLPGEFERLNQLAREGAEKVTSRCQSLSRAWADLLPTLDKMQALLSERGADHTLQSAELRLPTWTEWLRAYLKETGLDVATRTVQRHLTKYRGLGKQKTPQIGSPIKLSSRDQRRLLAATQCANELVAALKSNTEYRPLLDEYQRLTIGPERIEQLFDTMPGEAVPSIAPQSLPQVNVAGNSVRKVVPGAVESAAAVQPLAALPKAGNWSGLANYVSATCEDGFKAALGGLEPRVMAACLQQFVQQLTDRYCQYDRQGGQINVNIKFVQDGALRRQRAA
jgi:hypothetical protein